jgi:hypothetical protein
VGTPDHNNWLPPAFASYEPHHDRVFDGPTVRYKDHPTGMGQAHREPNPSNPQSYGTRRPATPPSSIRHLWAADWVAHIAGMLGSGHREEPGPRTEQEHLS